jgi:hypothetical protein
MRSYERSELIHDPVQGFIETGACDCRTFENRPISFFYPGQAQDFADIFFGGGIGKILLVGKD